MPISTTIAAVNPLQAKLQQLLRSIPAPPTPSELQIAQNGMIEQEKEQFAQEIMMLVEQLEQHVEAWKKVHVATASR
ncbi:hypothetical protein D3C86_2047860 [compost metagenome]